MYTAEPAESDESRSFYTSFERRSTCMATDANTNKRINHEKLTRFVQTAFEKLCVPAADAQIAAETLVSADLRGVDTHGVIRFSPHAWYVKWLSDGSMTAKPNIRMIS